MTKLEAKIKATEKLTGYNFNKRTKEFYLKGWIGPDITYYYLFIRNGCIGSYKRNVVLKLTSYNELPFELIKKLIEIWGDE